MLTSAAMASFIATLFSMMNPIGNIGVFAGMTGGLPDSEIRKIAWKTGFAIAVTLLLVVWLGDVLLRFFGISVDELRAAGGVVVLIIGLHMLFNKSEHKHSTAELEDAETRDSIAVVPMAIPITAGPGTMTSVLLVSQHQHLISRFEVSLIVILMAVLTALLYSFAGPLSRRLGESGVGVVTRIMGLVLSAIAMGMLAAGLKSLLPGLAG
ncbi:MarC family protein [Aestuariirhabdus sp. LZHN29]|uniref:MarC family protein n=1 Tax=Aestuariirhabdus sp. LZHN29 TaxID=3417462 RepID=UPI003CFA6341